MSVRDAERSEEAVMAIGLVGAGGATVCFPRARHLVRNAGGYFPCPEMCVCEHALSLA